MLTLTLPKTIEQEAIAKKIKNLLSQLPLKNRLEVEGEVSRSISEELAVKKQECGKNRKQWAEYLKEAGFVPQEAEKRVKLTKIPSWVWSVGTLTVVQLASPTYSGLIDDLMNQGGITQELAKARMDEVKEARKLERLERKAQEQSEVESKFFSWGKNIYGKRVLNIVEIPEAVGNELEQMLAVFKRASGDKADFPLLASEMIDICRESDHWLEIEAIAQYNNDINITPESIPLSQVGPGMRVEIVNSNNPRFGQQARITSFNNGGGWTAVFDSEAGKEQPQSEWVNTSDIVVVAI